ncbi:hypothetical protein PR202_ga09664 [Eleusine coracana subsp. coracana]|uniref:Uncharacterized protein n=1 Tax=Eleusine coracana subsp. coracana TaxID=191504 RepID=A0AAV5C3M6_ELECO|nr:hypothetical protein PR202_ga09664 [Eleusine coracana subsp. coracana]
MSAVEPLVLAHVIRDVLHPFTPTVSLRITYNNRLLLAGAELKPSAVVNKPRLDVGGSDLRVFYTLVLVDPDAPSPSNPSLREYLHWMVTDIPGTTGASFGQELMFYERPDQDLAFIAWEFARQYHLDIVAATYFNCQREAGSGGRRFRPESS